MGELTGKGPDVREYKNGSVTIKYRKTPMHDKWDPIFRDPGTLPVDGAIESAVGILNNGLLENTLTRIAPDQVGKPAEVDLKIIQQGRKNGIFLVETAGHPFVMILGRDKGKLARETTRDFRNLSELRTDLEHEGITPFVPETYAAAEHEGAAAFSVEFLPDHMELNVHPSPRLKQRGMIYPEYFMNFDSPKAAFVNSLTDKNALDMLEAEKKRPDYIPRPMYNYLVDNLTIMHQLIAKLYLVNKVTGKVPAEFSVNAGDFMTQPDATDFDLRLITVRGGWKKLPIASLSQWLLSKTELIRYSTGEKITLPIFDNNKDQVQIGIDIGREMYKSRKAS